MNNPKFENKLKQKVLNPAAHQTAISSDGYGFVTSYDASSNTATVMMSQKDSTDTGTIYKDVPCPVTLGVQNVAPTPGRPCWVAFKGNSDHYPVVTHFFNHVYNQVDYTKQTTAVNNTPRYLTQM